MWCRRVASDSDRFQDAIDEDAVDVVIKVVGRFTPGEVERADRAEVPVVRRA